MNLTENDTKVKPISSLDEFDMWQALRLLGLESKINTHIHCIDSKHTDKDPSCFIRAWHFHCFGCGAHGDSIKAVQVGKGFQTRQETIDYICEHEKIPRPDDKKT